jgi:hypothetical protein
MPRMPFQGVLVEDLLDANQGWVKPFCAGRIALLRQTWGGSINRVGDRRFGLWIDCRWNLFKSWAF